MFPWFRLARIGFSLVAESKVDLLSTTRVQVRVWPNDLDFNGQGNNGRYLALADIGRIHWFVRTGVLGVARRHRAIGDAIAKFRQDLKLFQRFAIHTRLIGWDRKWGFLEHRFVGKWASSSFAVAPMLSLRRSRGELRKRAMRTEINNGRP